MTKDAPCTRAASHETTSNPDLQDRHPRQGVRARRVDAGPARGPHRGRPPRHWTGRHRCAAAGGHRNPLIRGAIVQLEIQSQPVVSGTPADRQHVDEGGLHAATAITAWLAPRLSPKQHPLRSILIRDITGLEGIVIGITALASM